MKVEKPNPYRVGVLCNPLGGRVRKRLERVRSAAANIPQSLYREASSLTEFHDVLDEFAESEVQLLVVVAGDGTFHGLLSYMFREKIFQHLPVLCPLPAGTTNMTAYDFGIHGKPEKLLLRLAAQLSEPQQLEIKERPLLKIERDGQETLYGMFFGTGLIVEGVRFFRQRIRKLGATGEGVSGILMFRYLLSLLFSRSKYKQQIRIRENEGSPTELDYLLLFVSALDRLLVGVRPYWGSENSPMHMTSIGQSPDRLWRALPPLLTGRGKKLEQYESYHSRNLDRLELVQLEEFIIDGELYDIAEKNSPVKITANDTIQFLIPSI